MTKAVDTAALTALTAPARELLLSTTLSALLQERGLADAHDVVTLETDNTVADAMTSLAKHNVASAPLLRRSAASSGLGGGVVFLGFVDVPSLMKAFFKGDYIDRETLFGEPNETHASGAVELAPYPSVLREDRPPTFAGGARKPPGMLSLMETLSAVGPRFAALPLSKVPLGGDGCELFAASLTSSLDTLVRRGFLGTGGAAGWPTAHRACVFDFDAGKCLAVVSHTDLMRWLHPRLVAPGGPCAALGAATLTALGLSPKPRVYMVTPDEPAINAFAALLERGLPAAGVAGGAGDRAVIGALSLSDLKGLAPDKLASLALPVGEFLALAHQAVWSSAPSGPRRFGGGAAAADSTGGASAGGAASPPPTPPGGGLSHRDRLLQRHTLASLPPSASLAAAVEMLGAGRARAVFVVDQDSAPLAVVTPTDVLRLLAGGGQ